MIKLRPIFRNIRFHVFLGTYRLGVVYTTRWGWLVRSNRSLGYFRTKELAAQAMAADARQLANRHERNAA